MVAAARRAGGEEGRVGKQLHRVAAGGRASDACVRQWVVRLGALCNTDSWAVVDDGGAGWRKVALLMCGLAV